MINREATIRWKGYDPDDLKPHSRKRVWRVCDICERGRWIRFDGCSGVCNDCTCRLIAECTKLDGSRVGANNPNYGKEASEETRRKMSVSRKGQKRTNVQKKHISESLTGRKLTDAHKLAMSIAHTGKKLTDEHKKNIGLSKVGIPFSDEHKQKIGDTQRGVKRVPLTKEHREKLSNLLSGENNPNWKGGISFEPYCKKFNYAFKESIREKFGRTCFLCPTTEEENGRKLSVHHVEYNKNCLCDDSVCEFVPLCDSCHGKTNHNHEYWERLIIDKLRSSSAFNQQTLANDVEYIYEEP